MAATNTKVVHIHNSNGETSQYMKVSARVPEFLKVYGPDKGYRVLSQSTDYLDFAQARKDLCLALAAQGQLPAEHVKELLTVNKIVFKAQLVDQNGNVVAESSAIKPIWNLKDYESGETAAFQRLLARLGFGGEVFDSDEENDMQGQNLAFDAVGDPEPSPTETVTMQPVPVDTPHGEAEEPVSEATKTDRSTEQSEVTQQPVKTQVKDKAQQRGVKADPNKIQPAQLRQLESFARVKGVECPKVNTPDEFRKELLRLKSLPLPG